MTTSTDRSPRVPPGTAPRITPEPYWLPSELWVLVVSQLINSRDFPGAWTNCRRVSRSFRAVTEAAFLSQTLPELQVHLSLVGGLGRRYSDIVQLQLLGRSDGGERVHYGPQPGQLDDGGSAPPASGSGTCRHFEGLAGRCALPTRPPGIDGGSFGNPPLLIEWASKIYLSVCKGPTTYYSWSTGRQVPPRHTWIRPNADYTMDMRVDHNNHLVSFLWKPMLNILAARFAKSNPPV